MNCERTIHIKDWPARYKYKCGKPATTKVNGQNLCNHHARLGRFVFRVGEVGDIVARFNTEAELRANKDKYIGMRAQHLTRSRRRDIIL